MSARLVLGLMAAACLVIAAVTFGDLVGRLTVGVGYLYCPADDTCLGYVIGRCLLLVGALLAALVFVKLIDE